MFTTSFIDSKLTVDASKFDSVVEYLNRFGCKYETLRYGSGKCIVWIDEAPAKVIDALNAKFNAAQIDERFEYFSGLHDDYIDAITCRFCNLPTYLAASNCYEDLSKMWDIVKDEMPSLEDMQHFIEVQRELEWDATLGEDNEFADSFDSFQAWINNFDVSTGTASPFMGLSDRQSIKAKYRELAKSMHPDFGGDAESFAKLNEQYNRALQFVA